MDFYLSGYVKQILELERQFNKIQSQQHYVNCMARSIIQQERDLCGTLSILGVGWYQRQASARKSLREGVVKRQQEKFEVQPRQSRREMVRGESHYFLGQRYRLRIIQHHGAGKVLLRNKAIDLYVRPETSAEQREQVLHRWYRQQLKALIPSFLEKWQEVLGAQVADWGIKKMKTKWGACTIDARRIWINLELAKKPVECLEYIIVHELVHLLERHHNDRFQKLMDQFLPQWRLHREELNRAPLGYEKWDY